jgi:integrase
MRKKIVPITDLDLKNQLILKFSTAIELSDFHQLTTTQYSHNSALSMVNDWNDFIAFCISKRVAALPTSSTALRLYIERQTQSKRYSTIKRNVISISLVHRFLGFSDPSRHQQVQLLMRSMRLSKESRPHSATALTHAHINQLEATWNLEQLKALRDVAIIRTMFECALKRGQLCALTVGDVKNNGQDTLSYSVTIDGEVYLLSESTSTIIHRWFELSGVVEGPVFRSVDRHGNIGIEPLDVSSVYRVFRLASQSLGLQIHLSGQSPRAGAAKELSAQGKSLKEIQQFGRWLSPAMPAHYIGNQHIADNARLTFKSMKPWLT